MNIEQVFNRITLTLETATVTGTVVGLWRGTPSDEVIFCTMMEQ